MATDGRTTHRWGCQFFGSQRLDGAYTPGFSTFGAAWDDGMVARWSAGSLGMLWPERDAALVPLGGGGGDHGPAAP